MHNILKIFVVVGLAAVMASTTSWAQETNPTTKETLRTDTPQPQKAQPFTHKTVPHSVEKQTGLAPPKASTKERPKENSDKVRDLDTFFKKAQKDALENPSCAQPEEPPEPVA